MANEEQSQPGLRSYDARTMEGDLQGTRGSVSIPAPRPEAGGGEMPTAPQIKNQPPTPSAPNVQRSAPPKQAPPADLPPIPAAPHSKAPQERSAPPPELPGAGERKNPPPPSQHTPLKSSGGPGKQKILLLGVVAAVIVLLIIGQIWWFFLRPDEAPVVVDLPEPETVVPEPEEPAPTPVEQAPLLQVGVTETIALPSLSQGVFVSELEMVVNRYGQEIQRPIPSALVHIVTTVRENGVERVVTLEELSSLLNITVPEAVQSHLSGAYSLVLLPPVRADRMACEEANVVREGCAGPRLGIALNGQASALASALRAWEATMVSDLRPIVLTEFTASSGTFRESDSYRTIPIRYRNFPVHSISVSHTAQGNLVLIGTSMHTIRAMVDGAL